MSKYTDRQKLEQLKNDIWRQNFRGVSTMGPCFRQCGRPARGSAVCKDCLETDLAKLVGTPLAEDFCTLVRRVRATEDQMDERIEE